MKFDVVIGNPPFNDDGGQNPNGSNNRDEPIYHVFLEESYKLADKAMFISPARFLFNAGQTPKKWNEKMLNDKHLKVEYYEKNSANVFDNTIIKGGVAVTYRDANKDFGAIETFNTETQLNSVLVKVLSSPSFEPISNIAYPKSSYKYTKIMHSENQNVSALLSLGEQYSVSTTAFEKVPFIFHKNKPQNEEKYVEIVGRENNIRITKWIKESYITGPNNINFFKVAVPASNGSGYFGEILSNPIILTPQMGHTQTFMSFGKFENRSEAEALLKYFQTKFLRSMLGILKVTQHNPLKTWKYVPLIDFTNSSDINWKKSISEIDQQLYRKYGLDEEEINFIETKVREMD